MRLGDVSEGRGGDGGAAQGGTAAAAADADADADGESHSWFRAPAVLTIRLPRAQRAMLARRMMALTKAIIG